MAFSLSRRRALQAMITAAGGAAFAGLEPKAAGSEIAHHEGHHVMPQSGSPHAGHADFRNALTVDHEANGFDPHHILRDFDWGRESRDKEGRAVREWDLVARDVRIEIAPGVVYDAWTYNGRVPGPTLRAREGERLRIRFSNGSQHPHTIHFHGIHRAEMDGVAGIGAGEIPPGGSTVYEFDAQPAGMHVYHCHVRPLAEHIAKGLHGAFIIDPAQPRPPADEMVMVMNGFDTNFDRANELYASNTIPFAYMNTPIQVRQGELVRVYLANMLEYDLVNSFHLHGTLFDYYPTGTGEKPAEYTDTVMLCQGQRGVLEWRFPYPGKYMFHAHQSEFTELGWQGFFEVR